MLLNVEQLEKQLDKEDFQEIGSMAAFNVLETQFQMFITSRIYLYDEYVAMTYSYFQQYTQLAIPEFCDTLIQHMESVKKSFDEKAQHKRETSKPRFSSQVDVNNVLSKPITTHYLPKEREVAFAKPHHIITSSNSRISSKNMTRFSSNDMVHNHYLEEAKKKKQECSRNSEPSLMHYARSQSTVNGSKPTPRSNTQTSRNWPASKNSFVMTKTVPLAENSRKSRNFSDSKYFVCSTCQKCFFNANHDSCVTKFMKEVNSCAKVPSNQTTNKNKPVEQISVPKKPERQISKGHSFLIKKTSIAHEKTMTPRSCLSTTKVDSEPPNGSNAYITNQYECKQTLDVSVGTLNLSAADEHAMTSNHNSLELRIHDHSNEPFSSKLVPKVVLSGNKTATLRQELELLFHHHITMLRSKQENKMGRWKNCRERKYVRLVSSELQMTNAHTSPRMER
nr:hypothetical protein [Tanacetum cinerariifolium]